MKYEPYTVTMFAIQQVHVFQVWLDSEDGIDTDQVSVISTVAPPNLKNR